MVTDNIRQLRCRGFSQSSRQISTSGKCSQYSRCSLNAALDITASTELFLLFFVFRRITQFRQICLNGNWLAEAGFSTDTPVMVSVEQGRLVIEPVRG
ncbi:TPA: SymE family type I addiction module toxin [Salmonella enterica subsp. enterica serovar Concord]|nr:SymE family type I addiction module toxin [Salmonella enterica subsp. enterica serovar Concord]